MFVLKYDRFESDRMPHPIAIDLRFLPHLVPMKKLVDGLHQFQTSYFSSHQTLFEQLAQGQKPRVLFITCSDSRIDPNLITNAQVGELFVIRNAGNMIPPFGATDGGEGATLEYAIQALGIEQIIVCGHSFCGAMKGLLKLNQLQEEMPLVYDWLKHAEATRRMLKENYSQLEGEPLLDIAIAENVLTQIENLRTYPVVRAKLGQGRLHLHAWVYHIESGEVLEYDPIRHAYVPPDGRIEISSPQDRSLQPQSFYPTKSTWLPVEQSERIYRGSH